MGFYIYILDARSSYEEVLDEEIEVENGVKKEHNHKKTNITDFLKPGKEVIVQVMKNPIGNKGVRLTTNISIPGRFAVLLPFDDRCGVSRRIESREERKRLKEILSSLRIPSGIGVIIRTVGEKNDRSVFSRDVRYLVNVWKKIERLERKSKAPLCIYSELDIILKTIRDDFTEEVSRVIVDSKYEFKRIRRFLNIITRKRQSSLELYRDNEPMFHKFKLEEQIRKVFNRKIWLKSGGYLVFDQTEALIAIDINSGRNVGKENQEQTNLDINVEAAQEIARQIRLRNVGGIIIIDFIDMKSRRNRIAVLRTLREALKSDKAKNNILPVSKLGLVEMTRQRVQESTRRTFYDNCPCCHGLGAVKSVRSMSLDIYREIREEIAKKGRIQSCEIILHPLVADRLLQLENSVLQALPKKIFYNINTKTDINIPLDDYKLRIQ
ncbi:Rne/Rng family ribonuclease [Chlamydiota bacterium]